VKKVKKTTRSVKITKRTTVKKAASKTTKSAPKAKTVPAKKTVKKPAAKAVKKTVRLVKKTTVKPVSSIKKPKISKPAEKVIVPEKKPEPAQTHLGLPDGSEYQQTGVRRPLIVFPK